jgi:hypothetical protein
MYCDLDANGQPTRLGLVLTRADVVVHALDIRPPLPDGICERAEKALDFPG